MEWNQNYNHPKFSWKEKCRYPSIHYLGGFLPGLTELGLLVSVCELLVLISSSYQEDISVPNENMSVLCLEKKVGIPLPNSECTDCFAGFIFQPVRFNLSGPWTDIFSQAGQQHKTTRILSPTMNYCDVTKGLFPLPPFAVPAKKIRSNPAQWLFPWVDWSTSQRSRFLKHLAMPPFPSSDWKKRQKSCAASRSSFFADMIRNDDDFVLPEGKIDLVYLVV